MTGDDDSVARRGGHDSFRGLRTQFLEHSRLGTLSSGVAEPDKLRCLASECSPAAAAPVMFVILELKVSIL